MTNKLYALVILLAFLNSKLYGQSLELQNINGSNDILVSQNNFNIPRGSSLDVHQQNNKTVIVWTEPDTSILANNRHLL